jgi:MEMO1 family protein
MSRLPAVAGRFYPAEAALLREQVDSFLAAVAAGEKRIRARACLVPHAGYMYSGPVAAAVYGRLEIPRRSILIGPRHFPRGEPLAIISEGAWQTPLGLAPIDPALGERILRSCPLLREDAVAHGSEHSLEVQLPFLQRLAPQPGGFAFVPIVIGTSRYPVLEELGLAIAGVLCEDAEPILVVASSDMNHYEPEDVTRIKDRQAIEPILALDPRGLFDAVSREGISMCGYAAAVVMLTVARALGATHAELVRYATSGEANGEFDAVVGYAGIIIP